MARKTGTDYAAAYRLGRGLLRRPVLSMAAVALAAGAVWVVVAGGREAAFRPGSVSPAHASAIGASACGECHVPFEGPAEARCEECHADVPHQAVEMLPAAAASCGDCHFEHRGLDRLTLVTDASCTSCHRDLERTVAPGVALAAARPASSFGGEHPAFDLPAADPNTLKLNHAKHLRPLEVPGGTVTLACEDCHRPAAGEDGRLGRMRPVTFEEHCQRCHLLTFDPGLPEEQVPHAEPALVAAYVLRAFAGDADWRELTFEERRRLIVQDPERDTRYRLSSGERRAANQAEGYLFGTVCPECHLVEERGALPAVAPVEGSRDWLPAGAFPHARHGRSQGLECADCHGRAAESTATSDVLIPGIDACRRCHGTGAAEVAGGRRVPSGCVDCHGYHQGEPRRDLKEARL